MKKNELADLIEAFVNNTSGDWDWDDFISIKQSDPEIEQIRRRCANLPSEFPPSHLDGYCNNEGEAVLQNYVKQLRKVADDG